MTAARLPRRYVNGAYVGDLMARLSDRDWQIIADVWRCRVLSGQQITRLHFRNISERTRERTRRLVLTRLAGWGVLAPLERRIGGVRGGSAGAVWSLDVAGQRLVAARWPDTAISDKRARRPWTPGRLFVTHALAVSEAYVSLVEQSSANGVRLEAFSTEPLSWWPDGLGGYLKPDAYLALSAGPVVGHWWLEVDRATESLPTLRRKLLAYLDFVRRGQLGPRDVIPRVLISVPDERRRIGTQAIIDQLPSPAEELFSVSLETGATAQLSDLVARPP